MALVARPPAATEFSKKAYPKGLNYAFTSKNKEDLIKEYTPKFESVEKRDIAKNFEALKKELYNVMMDGKVIMDIGAGTGLFAKELSERAGPKGQVFLTEISDGFVEHLEENCKDLENVKVLKTSETKIPFEGQVDVILLCDVYHHFTYPKEMLGEIQRILSPGGRLIFIDFYRQDEFIWSQPKGWVLEHIRAGKVTFTNELKNAGFLIHQDLDVPDLVENYVLICRKSRTGF